MQLDFIKDATNPILCVPNGVGKTTVASNITHQSILKEFTALFTTAAGMLVADVSGNISDKFY
jgi:hypothetical protein